MKKHLIYFLILFTFFILNMNSIEAEIGVYDLNPPKSISADSWKYGNSSVIGGLIRTTAQECGIEERALAAYVNLLRTGQATMSGYYANQINFHPDMTAEDLVLALGRSLKTANRYNDKVRIQAMSRNENYTRKGLDDLVDELQSVDGKKAGRELFNNAYAQLKKVDHIQFDTPELTKYYEILIKTGMDKGQAWWTTQERQSRFRAIKDKKAVWTDMNNMKNIDEMKSYSAKLYAKWQKETDAETKNRIYAQYQESLQIIKTHQEAFKLDPVLYFINKDPYMPQADLNSPQFYKQRFERLDYHYENFGIVGKLRNYLTNEEQKELAKELKYISTLSAQEKEDAYFDLNFRYGNTYDKDYLSLIIENLLYENLITRDDIRFIEKAKTINNIKQTINHKKKEIIFYFLSFILLLILGVIITKKAPGNIAKILLLIIMVFLIVLSIVFIYNLNN